MGSIISPEIILDPDLSKKYVAPEHRVPPEGLKTLTLIGPKPLQSDMEISTLGREETSQDLGPKVAKCPIFGRKPYPGSLLHNFKGLKA